MLFSTAAYAETTTAVPAVGADVAPPQASILESMLPLLLIFVVFYFLLIRPQQKKFKQYQAMVSGLKKGDKVVTGGGLLGTIVKLEEDVLHIELSQGLTVRAMRNTISSIEGDKSKAVPAKKSADAKKPTANDN